MTSDGVSVIIDAYRYTKKPSEPWQLGEGGGMMYQYHYSFADNLCRLCKERNISAEKLADAIGKSPRQVNRYRNGQCENISLNTISRIADALDVSILELFST